MGKLNGKIGADGDVDDPKIEDECPFCQLRIVIDPEASTVTHARPTCDRFEELSANDFVAEVRRKVTEDVLSGKLGPLRVLRGGSA